MIKYPLHYLSLKLAMCLYLASCASAPENISYYAFSQAQESASQNKLSNSSDAHETVVLHALELPSFLKQSNLVMRLDGNQMHYSSTDVWSENLEQAITNELLMELNNMDSKNWYTSWRTPLNKSSDFDLHIKITHFYPTDNSEVLLAGEILLLSEGKKAQHQNFYFVQDLTQDGYSHAVNAMRQQLPKLAKQIDAVVTPASNH